MYNTTKDIKESIKEIERLLGYGFGRITQDKDDESLYTGKFNLFGNIFKVSILEVPTNSIGILSKLILIKSKLDGPSFGTVPYAANVAPFSFNHSINALPLSITSNSNARTFNIELMANSISLLTQPQVTLSVIPTT